MRYIPLLFLLLIPIQATADVGDYYNWMGVSLGKDVMHLNNDEEHFNALTLSYGYFPKEKGFGAITYLEYADYEDQNKTGNLWTIGFEPIWKYKFFYVGLGLSLSDDYTSATGTKWNFSIPVGVKFDLKKNIFIDANFRHRSHGSKLGIRESRDNLGLNILSLQLGVKFK